MGAPAPTSSLAAGQNPLPPASCLALDMAAGLRQNPVVGVCLCYEHELRCTGSESVSFDECELHTSANMVLDPNGQTRSKGNHDMNLDIHVTDRKKLL